MKLLSRYLDKILPKNVLLAFAFCMVLGFLMAIGVSAATSDRSQPSFHVGKLKSGVGAGSQISEQRRQDADRPAPTIQTKPACARVGAGSQTSEQRREDADQPAPTIQTGEQSLCGSDFYSPSIVASNLLSAQPDAELQKGQELYQVGQFLEAANVWKAAASVFQSRGDTLNQALVLSYLSLAYQQLGQLQQAEAAMGEAIALTSPDAVPPSLIRAQILNNQGQLQLGQGQAQTALETWKKSERLYRELGDRTGEIGTQLNQARALQALGFYLRARTTLEQVAAALNSESDSQLKVALLLNLGNVLRLAGDFTASQTILEQGLAVAQRLQSVSDTQVALLSLGNLAEAKEQSQAALQFYQQAAAENSPVRVQAQIHQIDLLVKLNRLQDAQKLPPLIQTQLANLPPSQTTIYAQIELAESLVKLNPKEVTTAAQLLATAQKQAKMLGNPRAESYALGRLGRIYSKTQQWEDAKRLSLEALSIAQAIRAPEIAYQWQWQIGQLLVQTGDRPGAIAAYTQAVNTLQSLRQDLVAINQDVQFSYREQVEPVYRELVDLLLQPPTKGRLEHRSSIRSRVVKVGGWGGGEVGR